MREKEREREKEGKQIEERKQIEEKENTMSTICDRIQKRLFEMQDSTYREFQANLIPTVEKERIIGVRTPELRKLAKELANDTEIQTFLEDLPHQYYDENNLHAFLLEQIKDYQECLEQTEKFLPYIDNWATCDMRSPKVFAKHKDELIISIKNWIASSEVYTVRFGIGMLMRLYLDDAFQEEYLELVAEIRSDEYYINMMIAWYFATALAKQYDTALPYIEQKRLSAWCHNKTIQKACESYRITKEQKEYLRLQKRKDV